MGQKHKLVVLISGRGSNLQALIDACAQPDFPAQIVGVISDVPDAYGLHRAHVAGIPAMIVNRKAFVTKREFETVLLDTVQQWRPDLICLAGFMRILSAYFINGCQGKIINIHPSLLPKYPGLDTHARALAAGDVHAGATVHWVTPNMDAGEIIDQCVVPILADDTPDTLAQRVLIGEHQLYPQAIQKILKGLITMQVHSAPAPVATKAEIERSTRMWEIFAKASLIAVVCIAAGLALMGLFLV